MKDGDHPGIAAREMELFNHFKIKAKDDPDGHGDDKSSHLLFDLSGLRASKAFLQGCWAFA